MKTLIAFLVLLFLTASHLHAADQSSLQQILDRHTEAVGGPGALASIHSLKISLNIVEPTFQVDAVYVADRSMLMRIDVFAGGKRVYSEGYDGKTAWEMGEDSGSVKEESPQGMTALMNGILSPDRFYSLQDLSDRGYKVEDKGRELLQGVSYHVIELTLNSAVTRLYIHPETWLIERTRETKAVHPDVDPKLQTTETVYSDFRRVDGVLRPFKGVRTDLDTGKLVQTETISKVETNPDIAASFFVKPGDAVPAKQTGQTSNVPQVIQDLNSLRASAAPKTDNSEF